PEPHPDGESEQAEDRAAVLQRGVNRHVADEGYIDPAPQPSDVVQDPSVVVSKRIPDEMSSDGQQNRFEYRPEPPETSKGKGSHLVPQALLHACGQQARHWP